MSVIIVYSIGIIVSGVLVASGAVKVFPPPSVIPFFIGLVWIVALEITVIAAYISTKDKDFH